jgi:hypothetical protein
LTVGREKHMDTWAVSVKVRDLRCGVDVEVVFAFRWM